MEKILTLLLIILSSLTLEAQINNKFENQLPPTENLLIHFASLRQENLKNLISYIQMECKGRQLKFCYFPKKLQRYLRLQAQVEILKIVVDGRLRSGDLLLC